MLFEHRTYTLKAGCVDDFWQAQRVRGYDLVRPILERQVGYFETLGGGADQVTHLYRYDSFEDWRNRLHGLYGVAALEPYFHKVRSMMLAQENKLLIPAPAADLNPLWGNTRDWLPAQGSKFQRAQPPLPTLVEQHTTVLLPGSMSLYWQAWREHGSKVLAADGSQLIGCLTSVVGIEHQVVLYRLYASLEQQRRAAGSAAHHDFLHAVQPCVVNRDSEWLAPAKGHPLSPLFD